MSMETLADSLIAKIGSQAATNAEPAKEAVEKSQVKEEPVAKQEKEVKEVEVEKKSTTTKETEVKQEKAEQDQPAPEGAPHIEDDVRSFIQDLDKDDSAEEKKSTKSESKSEKKSPEKEESDYSKYIEKAKEYESLLSNPIAKAFVDQLSTGELDIRKFADEIAGVDVKKMSSRELYEHHLKNGGYSTEDIDNELSDFDSWSKIKQDAFVKPFRSEIEAKNQEKLKAFSSKIESNRAAQIEAQKQQEKVFKDAMSELSESVKKLSGKRYNSLLITPEMAESIQDYVMNQNAEREYDEKGNISKVNIQSSIDTAIWKLYSKKMMKSLADSSKALGMEEVLKQRVRPNKTDVSNANHAAPSDDAASAVKSFREERRKMNGLG